MTTHEPATDADVRPSDEPVVNEIDVEFVEAAHYDRQRLAEVTDIPLTQFVNDGEDEDA